MSHIFYGKNTYNSIAFLNLELFLPLLAEITEGYTKIPEDIHERWSEFRSMPTMDMSNDMPTAIEDYSLLEKFESLISGQLAKVSITEALSFIDPHGLAWHKKYFDPAKGGTYTPESIKGISILREELFKELGYFEGSLHAIVEKREAILKIFSTQNIYYVTGEINFDKTHKILKSQLGEPYKNFVAYKGVIIESLLRSNTRPASSKSSTSVIGQSLEKAILDTYRTIGYSVSETSASGDFGIDVIAQSNIEKIGIQCKNYSGSVGVDSVMQAHSGGHYYGCTRYVVYSVNGFTPAALEMAAKLKVELLIFKGLAGIAF